MRKKMEVIIETYGERSQILRFVEELTELDEAMRSGENDKIVEEIADCSICLEQMFIIFGVDEGCLPTTGFCFNQIKEDAVLFVCRASRGRAVCPAPLLLLSGWLLKTAEELDVVEEVKAVAAKKLTRTLERASIVTRLDKMTSVHLF